MLLLKLSESRQGNVVTRRTIESEGTEWSNVMLLLDAVEYPSSCKTEPNQDLI